MHVQQKRNITFSLKGNDNYTTDVKISTMHLKVMMGEGEVKIC